MPHLRFDQTTADWVVFAPLRNLRPHTRSAEVSNRGAAGVDAPSNCPFCPGNEGMTPHEIDAVRAQDGTGTNWLVRVVPNKFPALQIEEDNRQTQKGDLFRQMGGCGAHEVLIESPQHDAFLGSEPIDHICHVIRMLHSRYCDLMRDTRFQTIVIFKNHGEGAGTSLQHPHWQIIATPVVPRMFRHQYIEATDYFDRTGHSLYEALLDEELKRNERVIVTNDEFVALMPFASHLPFETWVIPRRQQASFRSFQESQIEPLAHILQEILIKLYVGLEDPDFNLTVDTASRGDEDEPFFRWHIRILPRLTTTAGFELGSGMSINTVLPEEAAKFLKGGNHTLQQSDSHEN
ncbi:MAG: galactose-1-phosphate uridylyltransferase [Planctomycetaceae bacterium]